jgi:uncharacterized peroxidase-related enzyme
MSRISAVDRAADESVRRNFEAVQRGLGMVPNMVRTIAQSPRALEAYLGFSGALHRGVLSAAQQEQIALAVAEANACDYCLSAHTALGRGTGLSDPQLEASRQGRAADARTDAALRFAVAVLEKRGGVSDRELADVRAAGVTDGEIVEIVAHVALNTFTNYLNRVADTDIDFPKVSAGQLAQR